MFQTGSDRTEIGKTGLGWQTWRIVVKLLRFMQI